jgi:hypothetical protein
MSTWVDTALASPTMPGSGHSEWLEGRRSTSSNSAQRGPSRERVSHARAGRPRLVLLFFGAVLVLGGRAQATLHYDERVWWHHGVGDHTADLTGRGAYKGPLLQRVCHMPDHFGRHGAKLHRQRVAALEELVSARQRGLPKGGTVHKWMCAIIKTGECGYIAHVKATRRPICA